MKKTFSFISVLLLVFSCSPKEAPADSVQAETAASADYDTTAIDSFAAGASPNNLKALPDSVMPKRSDSVKITKPENAAAAKKD